MGLKIKARIIVVGGGGHAKVLISVLKKIRDFDLIGYADMRDSGELLGVPYLGTDLIMEQMIATSPSCCAVIGVGKVGLNDKRMEIFDRLVGMGFQTSPRHITACGCK